MALTLFFALAMHALYDRVEGDTKLEVGKPAPELAIDEWLNSGAHGAPPEAPQTLADMRGKVVVLEFWATWCAPCVAAFGHLNKLVDQLKEKDVLFLSITDEEREGVESFLSKRVLKTWVGNDRRRRTFTRYGVGPIPATFLIDAEGKLAAITSPLEVTVQAIRDVIAGRPPTLVPRAEIPNRPSIHWAESRPPTRVHALFERCPQTEGSVYRFSPGTGAIQGEGLRVDLLFELAWNVGRGELRGLDAIEDPWTYRLSIQAPRNDDEAARRLLRALLEAQFEVSVQAEVNERDVWVLESTDEFQLETTAFKQGGQSNRSCFSYRAASMDRLARALGDLVFETPQRVLDETGLSGYYNLDLLWTDGDFESVEEALGEIGLMLTQEVREVREFRVISATREHSED